MEYVRCVAGLTQGSPAREDDASPFHGPDSPRGGSENLALEFIDRGVHTVSLRFAPTVHGAGDHGFIATIAAVARAKGVSGYPGDGTNRWAAVHRSDAARLVALGLAKAPAGARLHAVAAYGNWNCRAMTIRWIWLVSAFGQRPTSAGSVVSSRNRARYFSTFASLISS